MRKTPGKVCKTPEIYILHPHFQGLGHDVHMRRGSSLMDASSQGVERVWTPCLCIWRALEFAHMAVYGPRVSAFGAHNVPEIIIRIILWHAQCARDNNIHSERKKTPTFFIIFLRHPTCPGGDKNLQAQITHQESIPTPKCSSNLTYSRGGCRLPMS